MAKVLITAEAIRELPGRHVDMLHAAGYETGYPAKLHLLTEDDTLEAMQGCVAALAGSEPYSDRVLAGLPQLRVIARNGVGYDCIDTEAATRRGVVVTITPEGNHQAVAEHALALMLAVARKIVTCAVDTRRGNGSAARCSCHFAVRPWASSDSGALGAAWRCGLRPSACGSLPATNIPTLSSPDNTASNWWISIPC